MHGQKFKLEARRNDSARPASNKAGGPAATVHGGVSPLPAFLSLRPDGVLLAIKLQPRAGRDEIVGPLGAELRIRVTAPPVDSAANEALVRFLVGWLDCPRSAVQLVRGHTSRHKFIKLHGLSGQYVLAKLRPG